MEARWQASAQYGSGMGYFGRRRCDTRVAPRGSRDPILAGGGGGATAHARDANRNRKRIAGGRAGPRERALVYNLSLLLYMSM